ncbi:GrpB-like predicted nucleotidyltransferase (UPF0157 family) [Alkalihalobacillus xiaoxiensis]|uniref:GrpB-like predicted nucleotidyltransferase (UPF0157 family) n=1 Tax=Shouchella xiaoxiensis TaxID=766895 RepID=A0ABS2SNT8_9BACI|nr:GrpB family protein [Shouchella xiaoxiensis]MBM7837186.1 GrpB-like predicted nucleotidyltransferase (UPF0157 family) [Shouchella xiaoxiensis]
MKQVVTIEPYKEEWRQIFLRLSKTIQQEVGDYLEAVEHVGSTSIVGLSAKPIIDLDLILKEEAQFPLVAERLTKLGYIHEGNKGIEGREAFARENQFVPFSQGSTVWMTHHLYVCPKNSPALSEHLAFRDYLRKHPEEVKIYEQIKRELAKTAGSREEYTDGKTEFVQGILRKAWHSS